MEPSLSSSTTIAVSICSPLTLKSLPLFMWKRKKPYHAVRFLYLNLKRLEGSIINSVGLSISLGTDVKNWEFTEEASQVESYIAIHFLEFLLHTQYQLTKSDSSRNMQPSAFSYPKNFTPGSQGPSKRTSTLAKS